MSPLTCFVVGGLIGPGGVSFTREWTMVLTEQSGTRAMWCQSRVARLNFLLTKTCCCEIYGKYTVACTGVKHPAAVVRYMASVQSCLHLLLLRDMFINCKAQQFEEYNEVTQTTCSC